MAYIEPNSTVQLSKIFDFPMDYSDVAYFESEDAQNSYFSSGWNYTLQAQSYQRRGRNRIRLEITMAQAENLTYMRFKNTSFENRWFYAFVTSTEYINNSTVEIEYSIDVFQTYFCGGHAVMGTSYISRLTTKTDGIGDYIEPESIPVGEYVSTPDSQAMIANAVLQPCIVVAVNDVDGSTSGVLYDHTYSGSNLYAFDTTSEDIANVDATINIYTAAGKPEAIVGIWMAPKVALPSNTIPSDHKITGGSYNNWQLQTMTGVSASSGINGYTPKNNKLYTYPYNFCRVTTGQGNHADYRYEFFRNNTPAFVVEGNLLTPVTTLCAPVYYKGNYTSSDPTGATAIPLFSEALSISQYPMCSWSYDTYAAWVAQNSVPMANVRQAWREKAMITTAANATTSLLNTITGMAGGALTAGLGIMSMNPVAAVAGVAHGTQQAINAGVSGINNAINNAANLATSKIDLVTSQLNADYSASIEADTMGGTISGGNLAFAHNDMTYQFSRWTITASRAKAIDDYFTMFGYAYNGIAPIAQNLHNRQYFTYIQTVDANCISGGGYSDTKSTIEQAFNRGIRLWWHGNSFRDFSVDNAVLS